MNTTTPLSKLIVGLRICGEPGKKNLSCNRSNWKMPYVSLSSFKLPFIRNKKEVAQLKQTVILKSHGVPLPSPNMERNTEEATHSPNLSWTITATCLPTFVLPVKDKRSILSSLAIAVLHNGTQSTVFNKTCRQKSSLHVPHTSASTREIFKARATLKHQVTELMAGKLLLGQKRGIRLFSSGFSGQKKHFVVI